MSFIRVSATHTTDGEVEHRVDAVSLPRSVDLTLVDRRGGERPIVAGLQLSPTEWLNLQRDLETLHRHGVSVELTIQHHYDRPERVRGWHRD
jgi:hypothetical protein